MRGSFRLLGEDPIEGDDVQVGIEPKVRARALHNRERLSPGTQGSATHAARQAPGSDKCLKRLNHDDARGVAATWPPGDPPGSLRPAACALRILCKAFQIDTGGWGFSCEGAGRDPLCEPPLGAEVGHRPPHRRVGRTHGLREREELTEAAADGHLPNLGNR